MDVCWIVSFCAVWPKLTVKFEVLQNLTVWHQYMTTVSVKSLRVGLKWHQFKEIQKNRAIQHVGHHSLPRGVHNVTFTQFVPLSLFLAALLLWHLIQSSSEKNYSQKIQWMMSAKWKCHCPILVFLFLCPCLPFHHCQMTKSGQGISGNTYRILQLLGFFSLNILNGWENVFILLPLHAE